MSVHWINLELDEAMVMQRLQEASQRYLDQMMESMQIPDNRLIPMSEEISRRLTETQTEADRRWNELLREVEEEYNRVYERLVDEAIGEMSNEFTGVSSSGQKKEERVRVDWRKEGF